MALLRTMIGKSTLVDGKDPQPAVTDPTGGVVIDTEARAAIVAVTDALAALGLLEADA